MKLPAISQDALAETVSVEMSVGHLVVIWDILARRLSDPAGNATFSDDEKRAIWAMEDLVENTVMAKVVDARPDLDWDDLIACATTYIRTLPVDFLD